MTHPPRELVLHAYWRSSASYRVRLALAVKKLAYRVVPVNILKGEQSSQPHIALAPNGYVPSLVIDGVPFFESVAILELLDELYPEPRLYPCDPFAKARVRALVELVNAGIQPLQNLNVLHRLSESTESRNEWVRHFVARGLASFERAIEVNEAAGVTGRFSYGDSLTTADLVLIPQLAYARRMNVDLSPFPRVVRADASATATPELDAATPERQPDFPG